jgi:hypothetical protein
MNSSETTGSRSATIMWFSGATLLRRSYLLAKCSALYMC